MPLYSHRHRHSRPAFLAVALILAIATSLGSVGKAVAQQTAEALLAQAVSIYDGPDTPPETLTRIRSILEQIVAEHPASSLAVDIILKQSPPGLDIAAIERGAGSVRIAMPGVGQAETGSAAKEAGTAPGDCIASALKAEVPDTLVVAVLLDGSGRIAGLPELLRPEAADAETRAAFLAAAGALDACAPYPGEFAKQRISVVISPDGPVELSDQSYRAASEEPQRPPPASSATQAALDLDKHAIRDIQARLLSIGHDPNGIDGLIGPGTRGALESWQRDQGIAATGYLDAPQLARLKQVSQGALDAWLENPENAKLHTPPPPLQIGPGNFAGTWRYTSHCGAGSKVDQGRYTGVIRVQHAGGNRYAGAIRDDGGLRGKVSGRLVGRQWRAEINWGLLIGKEQVSGRVADYSLIIRGSDSSRCSFVARKTG